MVDYWRIYHGGPWDDLYVCALCGGCNREIEMDLSWEKKDGVVVLDHYVLPEKCPECGWVPTKFCPGEN